MKRLLPYLLYILLCFYTDLVIAQSVSPDDIPAAKIKLEKERTFILSQEKLPALQRIRMMLDLGLWKEAESLLSANENPAADISALKAEYAWLNNNFREAEDIVSRIMEKEPGHAAGTILKIKLYIEAWELHKAEAICNQVLENNPKDEAIVLLLGRVAMLMKNYPRALALAQQVQQWNPGNADAYLLEADVHFWNQHPAKAEEALRTCLELDPFNADARFNYGYAIWRRVDATQLPDMASQWELALEINPLHYMTHWHWGNGHTHLTYADYADPDENEILTDLAPADSLIAANQTDQAIELIQSVSQTHFSSVIPDMMLGSVYYMNYSQPVFERMDSAQKIFLGILARKPHYGPAHNGLAAVIKFKRFQYLSALDSLEKVISQTVIQDPASFEEVFPDASYYPGDRVPKMIWNQLYSSVVYFPFLAKLNRKFVIPPLHIDLARAMNTSFFRGATTFDNRQWMDIRGVGSGATGIEYVERGAHLERNVTLHEYVHLFHGTIFTDKEMRQVRERYYYAMENDQILDYYSANNEFEYLAQTFTAYFIPVKVHPLNHKSINTTHDLKTRDPQNYAFIDSLVQRHQAYLDGDASAMASNWSQVYLTLANQAFRQNSYSQAITYLDSALVWDSLYQPVHLFYAHVLAAQKQYEPAREKIVRAENINPGYAPVYTAFANLEHQKFLQGTGTAANSLREQIRLYKQAFELEDDLSEKADINERYRTTLRDYGNLAQAIEAAEAYVAQAPTISTYLRDRREEAAAFVHEIRGNLGYPEEAITFFDTLISLKPQNYRYREQFARVLITNGKYDRALKILGEAQTILEAAGSPRPSFTLLMATAALNQGDTTRAVRILEPILDESMAVRGEIYPWIQLFLRLGKKHEAEELFKRESLPRIPYEKASYYYCLGMRAETEGKPEAAIATYTQAIEANIYHHDARLALLRLLDASGDKKLVKKIATRGSVLPIPPGEVFMKKLEKYLYQD